MSVHHHPESSILWEYATGSVPEPLGLVLALHLSHCRACSAAVARYEEIGGALLEDAVPTHLDVEEMLGDVLNRLNEPDNELLSAAATDLDGFPGALSQRLPTPFSELPWKRVSRGVSEFRLAIDEDGYVAKLIQIEAGAIVPRHTHRGEEFTVVLKGGFRDGEKMYRGGDFAVADSTVQHNPVATGAEPCICVAMTNAPLKLLTPLGRIFEPLLRLRNES
jgi:putative transcriptional regulator